MHAVTTRQNNSLQRELPYGVVGKIPSRCSYRSGRGAAIYSRQYVTGKKVSQLLILSYNETDY